MRRRGKYCIGGKVANRDVEYDWSLTGTQLLGEHGQWGGDPITIFFSVALIQVAVVATPFHGQKGKSEGYNLGTVALALESVVSLK